MLHTPERAGRSKILTTSPLPQSPRANGRIGRNHKSSAQPEARHEHTTLSHNSFSLTPKPQVVQKTPHGHPRASALPRLVPPPPPSCKPGIQTLPSSRRQRARARQAKQGCTHILPKIRTSLRQARPPRSVPLVNQSTWRRPRRPRAHIVVPMGRPRPPPPVRLPLIMAAGRSILPPTTRKETRPRGRSTPNKPLPPCRITTGTATRTTSPPPPPPHHHHHPHMPPPGSGNAAGGPYGSGAMSSDGMSEDEDDDMMDDESEGSGSGRKGRRRGSGGSEGGGDHSRGRWTMEEHEAFLQGLRLYGREWKRVAADIKTRSSAQIRSHAQKYFAKLGGGGKSGSKKSPPRRSPSVPGSGQYMHHPYAEHHPHPHYPQQYPGHEPVGQEAAAAAHPGGSFTLPPHLQRRVALLSEVGEVLCKLKVRREEVMASGKQQQQQQQEEEEEEEEPAPSQSDPRAPPSSGPTSPERRARHEEQEAERAKARAAAASPAISI